MTERLARTARLRAAGSPLRITAFGSSTTEGYGASDPSTTGYPPRLRDALAPYFAGGVLLSNQGVSGETIDAMGARIGAVVAETPDLVIWQAGSNDGPQGVPVERFNRIMADGVERIRGVGADLVLVEPQYCGVLEATKTFWPFLESVRMFGLRDQLPVFRRYDAMRTWSEETGLGIDGLSPDGMHMNDVGYKMLGEAIAAFVLERSS